MDTGRVFSVLRPERVLAVSLVGFSTLWVLAPIRVAIDVGLAGPTILAAGYLGIFLGIGLGYAWDRYWQRSYPVQDHPTRDRILRRALRVSLPLALTGALFRIYDRYVLRGIGFSVDFLAVRGVLADVDATILGAVGGGLEFFCWIPLFVVLTLRATQPVSRAASTLAWIVFFYPAVEYGLTGQRFVILTTMVMLGLYLVLSGRLPLRPLLLLGFGGGVLLLLTVLSAWLILRRYELQNMTPWASIELSGYAFTVRPTTDFIVRLQSTENSLVAIALFTVMNLAQYLLHGVFEFFYLIENYRMPGVHSLGEMLFRNYFELMGRLGINLSVIDPWDLHPNIGIYTSFLGPMWADFGWVAIALCVLLGFLAQRLWRRAQTPRGVMLGPLYCYTVYALLMSPVVNFIVYGSGNYVLIALLGAPLLASVGMRRTVRV